MVITRKEELFFGMLIVGIFFLVLFLWYLKYYQPIRRSPTSVLVVKLEDGYSTNIAKTEPLPAYSSPIQQTANMYDANNSTSVFSSNSANQNNSIGSTPRQATESPPVVSSREKLSQPKH